MKTQVRLWQVAMAALLVGGVSSPSFARRITVPRGTDIPLVFDQNLSSKTAHEGDSVTLHVAEPVKVDGETVIAEGAKVTGTVTKVSKRKHFGVNAKMQLSFSPVRATNGSMIQIEAKGKGNMVGSRTGEAAGASAGGALVLGPIGLVGGYFVVGKNVEVHPGDKIVSEVARDTTMNVR